MSKAKPKDSILDYMLKSNRPYSVVDVFNNLHKEHGKTLVQKTLEQLSEEGELIEKTYGKQKIYFVNQSKLDCASEDEIKKMDADIAQLTEELKEISQSIKAKDNQLSSLSSSLTTSQIESQVKKLKESNRKAKERLDGLQNNEIKISVDEKEKIYKENDKFVKEWRKRKRMTNEMLDAIMEGYPKSKKILFEEIGVETDEDVKVSLPK